METDLLHSGPTIPPAVPAGNDGSKPDGSKKVKKHYQIDGDTIFCIGDDGSISKFGSIDDIGNIAIESPRPSKKRKVWGYWLVIVALIGFISYLCHQSEIDAREYNRLSRENVDNLNNARAARHELATVGHAYPMVITDIKIGNVYNDGRVETEYGERINSRNTMYLQAEIFYNGLVSETATLYIKWIMPNGSLSTGTSSPRGYSTSTNVPIAKYNNQTRVIGGWGNSTRGNWRPGTYRIEVWYGDVCLKAKSFTIH